MNKENRMQENMTKQIIETMTDKKLKLSTAESFTGGSLVYSFIEVPGASEVIDRSFVVYSDQAKNELLKVSKSSLEKYSAVSDIVARQMADGLYKSTGSDICISTTGYAGSFNEVRKPEDGHIFFCILYKGEKKVFEHKLAGNRDQVISHARLLVYKELIKILDA